MNRYVGMVGVVLSLVLTACASTPRPQDAAEIKSLQDQVGSLNADKRSLEDQADALNQQIASLKGQLGPVDAQVSALNDKVSQLQNQIAADNTQIAAKNDRVTQLQGDLSTAQSQNTANAASMESLQEKYNDLQLTSADLSKKVESLRAGDTKNQADALAQINDLNKQVADLKAQVSALTSERDHLQALAALDQKDLEDRVNSLRNALAPEIASGDISIKLYHNILVVGTKETVLFAPDSPVLRPEADPVLKKMADVFKKMGNRVVRVEGNTAVAISRPETLRLYPTSWHLAAARAANVVEYLQQKCGLDPLQLVATSLGEFHPRGNNATEAGKALNRRVDFVVMPRSLYDIDQLAALPNS
jgi:chemotaxis protein MotB